MSAPDRLACGLTQGPLEWTRGGASFATGLGPGTCGHGPHPASVHTVLVHEFPELLLLCVHVSSLLAGGNSNPENLFSLVPLHSPHPSQFALEGRSPKQHVERTSWQQGPEPLGWRPPWPARESPGSRVSLLVVPGGFQEGCGTVSQKTDQGLSWDATDVYECARPWG